MGIADEAVEIVGHILVTDEGSETIEKFKGLIEGTGGDADSAGMSLSTLGAILSGVVVAGALAAAGAMADFLGQSAEAAMDMQDKQVLLNATLKNTGTASGVTADQVDQLAEKYSKLTKYSDDQIVSADTVLARFGNISSSMFPAAQQATLDLATAMGTDATTAATQLGKILEDPIAGLARLKAAGVDVSPAFQKMIKDMAASGDIAGADQKILDALNQSIGGVSEAAGSTVSGQFAELGNTFEEVKEKVGAGLLPMLSTLGGLLQTAINSPQAEAFIQRFSTEVGNLAGQVVNYIPQVIAWFQNAFAFLQDNQGIIVGILVALGVAIVAFAVTAITAMAPIIAGMLPVIAIMAAVGAAGYLLYQAWTTDFGGIREKTESVLTWVKNFIQTSLAAITAWWSEHGDKVIATVEGLWDGIKTAFNNAVAWIKILIAPFLDILRGNWTQFGSDLRVIVDAGWTNIKTAFTNAVGIVKGIVTGLITDIKNLFANTNWGQVGTDIVHGIGAGLTAAIDWIKTAAQNVAKAALDAAKGFLGIKSPSSVFMEVGQNVMLGWAQGMQAMAGLPAAAAQSAASSLVQTANQSTANIGVQSQQNWNVSITGAANPQGVAGVFNYLAAKARAI